jgi:hypothetical protein
MRARVLSRSTQSQKVPAGGTSAKVCWVLGTGSLKAAASLTILLTWPRVTLVLGLSTLQVLALPTEMRCAPPWGQRSS